MRFNYRPVARDQKNDVDVFPSDCVPWDEIVIENKPLLDAFHNGNTLGWDDDFQQEEQKDCITCLLQCLGIKKSSARYDPRLEVASH